jgi:hypothetical protein
MLKKMRPFPEIILGGKSDEELKKIVVVNDRSYFTPHVVGCYLRAPNNHIVLKELASYTESYAIEILNHEIEHWAQFGFLEEEEIDKIMKEYFKHPHDACFIERINPYS